MTLCLTVLTLMAQTLIALEAVKITKAGTAIVIDGKLDEAAWAQAEKITPLKKLKERLCAKNAVTKNTIQMLNLSAPTVLWKFIK